MNIYKSTNVSYYEPDDKYTFTPPKGVLFIDRDIHTYWNLCYDLTISSGIGYFSIRLGDAKYGLYITVYHFTNGTPPKLEICFNDHMMTTIDVPTMTYGVAHEFDWKFARGYMFLFLNEVQVLELDVGLVVDTEFEAGYIQVDTESATSTYVLECMVYKANFAIDHDTYVNGSLEVEGVIADTLAATGICIFGSNVGIGTTVPKQPLDVVGNINFTGNIYKDGALWNMGVGDSIPIGTISPFYSSTLTDSSWLICDGATYQRSHYVELANTLGVSPSATTFQVPDLRDKFLKGKNTDTIGTTGGSATTTLSVANLPDHTHTGTTGSGKTNFMRVVYAAGSVWATNHTTGFNGNNGYGDTSGPDFPSSSHWHDFTTSSTTNATSTPFTNQPPYTTIIYIIKAKNNQYPALTNTNWSSLNSNVFYQGGSVGIGTNVPLQLLDVSGNSYFRGNVGIGTTTPIHKLDVSGNINLTGDIFKNGVVWNPNTFNGGTITDSLTISNNGGLTLNYIQGLLPQTNGNIIFNSSTFTFQSKTQNAATYSRASINVANLDFTGDVYKNGVLWNNGSSQWTTSGNTINYNGTVNIHNGSPAAVLYNYMAAGSLTIGGTNANFGGGTNQWSTNTAGLLMECADNTEIAIHDAATRVASFMYYEGGNNRFHIGRNMGWGTTPTYFRATVYCDTWLRTYGDAGWYSESYGGGWYMVEPTYVRVYGNKNIYTGGCMRADGGGPGATYTWGSGVASGNSGGWYVNTSYYGNVEHYFGGRFLINGPCYLASDARIKTDVEDLDENIVESIISQLKPKKYTYIDKWRKGDKTHYGLIAQEVKPIFPDGCYTFEDFIPNICEIASNVSMTEDTTSFTIFKAQDIQLNDVLKIHYRKESNKYINQDVNENTIDDGQEEITEAKVISINDGYITVDKKIVSEVLFIYGTKTKDVMGVNYNNFIPLLITTCQTLIRKNQTLENRLSLLEQKLNLLLGSNM